jgi:hypothetical protein
MNQLYFVDNLKILRDKILSSWQLHILIFVTGFAIVVLRRPDAILNPQFWAEDGAFWYADAYNKGVIHSIFLPLSGYFQTITRFIGAFVQIFPFSSAPLVFNVIAIIIKVLPANLFVSSRFSLLIPNQYMRIFVSFLYLALPNSREIHANLAGSQWHLALLAFMVIIAAPSLQPIWRCFDIGVILISGLSGPFSLMLTPIAALRWYLIREKWSLALFLLAGSCALIQIISLVPTMLDSRSPMTLGATPGLFVRILSSQVFLGTLIGQRGLERIVSPSGWYGVVSFGIAIIGLAMIINALFRGPMELRLFIIFAALIFGTALISPQVSYTIPQWQALSSPGGGGRYWFIPMLAFLTVLIWMLARSYSSKSRIFAASLLSIMAIGIILDWQHPRFTDFNFKDHAHRLETSPKGTIVLIPINPPGWSMSLIKH